MSGELPDLEELAMAPRISRVAPPNVPAYIENWDGVDINRCDFLLSIRRPVRPASIAGVNCKTTCPR
jgi:hypothetical protein